MRFLDNFIEDRRLAVLQRTSISADVSPSDTAAAAISAKSPVLFLCFIYDITVNLDPDTNAELFADDTALWRCKPTTPQTIATPTVEHSLSDTAEPDVTAETADSTGIPTTSNAVMEKKEKEEEKITEEEEGRGEEGKGDENQPGSHADRCRSDHRMGADLEDVVERGQNQCDGPIQQPRRDQVGTCSASQWPEDQSHV